MISDVVSRTNNFLNSISKKSDSLEKPSEVSFIIYVLAKEFGITKLDEYPLPYLMELVTTFNYIKDKEIKETKKLSRKK